MKLPDAESRASAAVLAAVLLIGLLTIRDQAMTIRELDLRLGMSQYLRQRRR